MTGKLDSNTDCLQQAFVPGDAATGDVEGSAVVDRGADDGQAERHIDSPLKSVHLDGDVPLVVILGHHHVELAPGGTPEDGIRGPGPRDGQSLAARPLDGRLDRAALLITEQSALPSVRVQPRDGDARLLETK